MPYTTQTTALGVLIFTPAGTAIDTGDTNRPRYFRNALLAARIGLTSDQARGFFI